VEPEVGGGEGIERHITIIQKRKKNPRRILTSELPKLVDTGFTGLEDMTMILSNPVKDIRKKEFLKKCED
jgi:hypothetical protein